MKIVVLSAVLGLAPSATALAEPARAETPTRYAFDDELVAGDQVRPQHEVLVGRTRRERSSLIEVRSSYVPELLEAVEDL